MEKQKENNRVYSVEREFLAKVSVTEFVERIIKAHIQAEKEHFSE